MKTIDVSHDGELLGYVFLRGETEGPGCQFLTPPDSPMQVALIRHGKGHTIRPHAHHPVVRVTTGTPEVLIVTEGSVTLWWYTVTGEAVAFHVLQIGDMAVLLSGGHGLTAGPLGVELIECKLGPFPGTEADKYYLPGA